MKNVIKCKSLLVFLAIIFTSTTLFSQDPNFHIYICFGQSNMEGQGTIENQDKTVDSRFKVMEAVNCAGLGRTQGSWYTAVPPLCRCGTGLSPVDYFGRTLVSNLPTNVTVGVIHVAVAGSKIELFDKNNYASYAASEATWMQNIIAEYGGNPYGRIIELAKSAQKDGVIKGILIHQGESNTGDTQWPNKVKGVYDNLLADLSLNAANVPLLAGQVVDAAQGGQCASMNTIIGSLPNTIPTSYIISSSNCAHGGDNLHFSSAAYRVLGERYANQMLTLLELDDSPIVTVTSPQTLSLNTAPATITLNATASSASNSIAKVEFYNGTTKLGEDLTAPYSLDYNLVAAGTYSFTAVATDNANVSTTSSAIAVTVNGPSLNGEIIINAKGVVGDEIIELEVDGDVINSWTLSTTYANYTATANVNGVIRVNYTNDDGADRDAQVDFISVSGITYEAEDQAVNTGYYANGSCGGGGNSELMHCSGFIEFVTNPIDVVDNCPNDPNKTEAGLCGCGIAEGTCSTIQINLKQGWNLIGCPLIGDSNIESALSTILDYVEVVKDNNGFYLKDNVQVVNSLTQLHWGMGYYVKVSQACVLRW